MRRFTSVVSAAAVAFAITASANAAELVKYKVVNGDSIEQSLTGKPGDPEAGKKAFLDRRGGNCLSCHAVTALKKEPFHGKIGPSLDGVSERLKEGQIRMQLVNSKAKNPDSIMPAFYRLDGLHRVLKNFDGKTILSANQVEDIVAYVRTLK